MKLNYRTDLFRELRDELVEELPKERRMAHAARAEQLLADLESKQDRPYGYYHHRITNQQPLHGGDARISADDVRHDVRKLVEDVWDSANVPIESVDERVLTIDDLTRMFNVSAKTISRWRDRGLIARRYMVGSRKQLGFPESAVDRFVRRNPDRVSRGARFSQLAEPEKLEIIELARRLADGGESSRSVLTQVAAKTNRSVETVRYTIKRFDERHPDRAVLAKLSSAQEETHERIFTAYRRGASVSTLARQFRRSESQVNRIVREMRLMRIMELPLDYMDSPEFRRPHAEAKILGPPPQPQRKPRKTRPPADLPAYLASLYETPLLTKEQEQHLFRKLNFLKYRASKLRSELDPARPSARNMGEIEQLYEEAVSVKNQIIQANLRLVVSVAKKYVTHHVTLFDLISDGNMSLIKAVEKFDYSLGNKFSTYATWAIKKNYARTFSTHLRQQDRFRSGHEEVLSVQAAYRADPLERETAQSRYEYAVSEMLEQLDDRERRVITKRFGLAKGTEPLTLKEVGDEFGVSKERVRQIEARAIKKLRQVIRDQQIDLVA